MKKYLKCNLFLAVLFVLFFSGCGTENYSLNQIYDLAIEIEDNQDSLGAYTSGSCEARNYEKCSSNIAFLKENVPLLGKQLKKYGNQELINEYNEFKTKFDESIGELEQVVKSFEYQYFYDECLKTAKSKQSAIACGKDLKSLNYKKVNKNIDKYSEKTFEINQVEEEFFKTTDKLKKDELNKQRDLLNDELLVLMKEAAIGAFLRDLVVEEVNPNWGTHDELKNRHMSIYYYWSRYTSIIDLVSSIEIECENNENIMCSFEQIEE